MIGESRRRYFATFEEEFEPQSEGPPEPHVIGLIKSGDYSAYSTSQKYLSSFPPFLAFKSAPSPQPVRGYDVS